MGKNDKIMSDQELCDTMAEIAMVEKIKLEVPNGNEPTCPECGTWNAMLRWADKDDDYVDYERCRDCGYKVLKSNVEYVYKTWDEARAELKARKLDGR